MKHSIVSSISISIVLLIYFAAPSECEQKKDGMVAYIKGSLPNQIYRCIQRFNILRCLKYFVLLRLEARDYTFDTTNSTTDFLGKLLQSEKNLPSEIPDNVTRLDDEELNDRLTEGFQKFFNDRPIQLHFIPNMMVKIIPSHSNDLEVSLKKLADTVSGRELNKNSKAEDEELENDNDDDYSDEEESNKDVATTATEGDMKKDEAEKSGMRKKKGYYLQLGIPLLLAPYMVFASFLPMLIPVLKLATAFTTIINVTALVASILYFARQHALEREMQQTVYFNPGYKERK